MDAARDESIEVRTAGEVAIARQAARKFAVEAALSIVDQTKLVTATSELARNMVIYGGGGVVRMQIVFNEPKRGVRLTFEDKGPGIADISLALKDGYTTGSGLGLGLSGSKRLVDEFQIRSAPGEGTTVTITKWK
jgi:serine/threonine-protein kinase RsbT